MRTERSSRRHGSNRALVITGTPGVGKSSVSELLAPRIGARLVHLADLVSEERLYVGLDKKRDTLIADLAKVSDRLKEVTASFVGNVVIEGHYAVEVVPSRKVRLVFVLRRDPQELRGVLEGRGYGEEKVRENLAAEILDVCLYDAVKRCGAKKVCEIDATGGKAEDTVKDILLVLDGRKECKVGIVDWLGKLESEGKLDEYLRGF